MNRRETKEDFPWWLLITGGIAIWLIVDVASDPINTQIFKTLSKGIAVTLQVTAISFCGASVFGLLLAMGARSRFLVLRQLVRFYVEIIRGVPILVLVLYFSFVFPPALTAAMNAIGVAFSVRDVPYIARAIAALICAYSAFLSEVFRAGLQSVDPGQIEAAKALGLKPWQRFRHVVFPQAFRVVLPPWGNDFVAMVKDSSLVSVLGVADVTQMAKVAAAGNFRYFETYNVVAMIYLFLTITLSLALRRLERYLRDRRQ
ncbi:MAG: amino acid ABC transporter permease [Deltaproteobacteria bacterium]